MQRVGGSILSVAMLATGAVFGVAPAAAAGCPKPKSYEQTFNANELNALMGEGGQVEQERARFINGVNNAGIRPGSEITLGAGVNPSVAEVPYFVVNEKTQGLLSTAGYRTVSISKLAVDASVAALVRIEEKSSIDCKGPVEV